MSDARTVDLSPNRISALPPWAQACLAARDALRVLPVFNPPDDAATRAAVAMGLASLRTSLDPGLQYRGATDNALTVLGRKADYEERIAAARECLIASVAPVETTRTLSALAAAQKACAVYGPPAFFLAPAAEDVSRLEEINTRSDAPYPRAEWIIEFFQRPLFRSDVTPDRSQQIIGAWGTWLEALRMADIRDIYVRIRSGIVSDENLKAIDVWLHAYESQFATPTQESASAPAPAPAPPPAPAAAPAPRPDAWMLADRPLAGKLDQLLHQDKFGFKDYADPIAAILDHRDTGTPFTMAINAPWGAGKTTLANMIEAQLEQRTNDRGATPHIVCWFNAWMHDDAKNLATAFVAHVSRIADEHRHWVMRLLQPLPSAMLAPKQRLWRRILCWPLVLIATFVLASWLGDHLLKVEEARKQEAHQIVQMDTTAAGVTTHTTTDTVTRLQPPESSGANATTGSVDLALLWLEPRLVVLGGFFTAIAGLIAIVSRMMTSASLAGFVNAPDKAAETGAIPAAQKQVGNLIRQATWRGNRFVVFVDDIERCTPPRSIDVLDAINQLMDHPNVIVVLLGDMASVAAAAQLKYKDIADVLLPNAGVTTVGPDRGKEAFGRLYLQKIIQFQFDLPIPPKETIQEYMTQLAKTPVVEGGASGGAAT